MSSGTETNAHLIWRIRDGNDAAAWSRFVRQYEPLVLAVCRRHGLQQTDASDVVQEVFAAIAGAMPRFCYDAARGSFRSWLIKVTRSKLANYFQERRRHEAVAQAYGAAKTGDFEERPKIERDESLDGRWNLLDRVKAEIRCEFRAATWNAFWLTAMQGFSAQEVAGHLGISVQAVYIAKSRVLKRFRARVKELATTT
jgi:RNA polymerase sigma-70 factor (ECF subfamily)